MTPTVTDWKNLDKREQLIDRLVNACLKLSPCIASSTFNRGMEVLRRKYPLRSERLKREVRS